MFDDEKPEDNINLNQQEEEDDQISPNIPQTEMPPNSVMTYQPQMNYGDIVENNQDDILVKSSIGGNNNSINQIGSNYINNSIETIVPKPIILEGNPIYSEQPQLLNSYSFSNIPNKNNPFISSSIPQNENNVYKTVYLENNDNNINNIDTIASNVNEYEITNTNIYETKPLEQYSTEQIISNNPQYSYNYENNNNQIISKSTPVIGTKNQNFINTYSYPKTQTNSVNKVNYSYSPNYNNNIQDSTQVIHINDEAMKNPQMAKYVEESERHINNYLSKRNNQNKENQVQNYSNITNGVAESNIIKSSYLKGSYNKSNFMNDNKDLDNFNPELWKNFYDINDQFFTHNKHLNSTHNKTINNPELNEVYIGDINNENEKDGFGKLISPDIKRIGEWRKNKFQGWGREIRKDGKIFEGKFINGSLIGKGIYKDGAELYIGEFYDFNKHGIGELFTSSYHYVGNFNNNNMDGKGRIEIYDEGIFEGNFNRGQIDGQGVFKFKNGDFYEGEMKKGKMDGYGRLTYANGETVEGKFAGGKSIKEIYSYRE